MSKLKSLVTSMASLLARRARRLTSMEEESTTALSMPREARQSMEPEAVAAGLVAGADRRVVGQAEAAAGAVDLAAERAEVAGRDGDAARGHAPVRC